MLYLVATPIGNLGDISLRALEILRGADLIAAEDTRHSGHLLRHFQIQKPLTSYHEHNEAKRTTELISLLEEGKTIALVTDAGLPAISDPGHRLLTACIERGLPYSVVPGASAVLTALVGSGFPTNPFSFCGFLPVKSGQRDRALQEASQRPGTTLFFESPHRLLKTLDAAVRILPERLLCVARELTKQFEEYRRGTPSELLAHYTASPAKGEIVLLVAGQTPKEARDLARDARKAERHSTKRD